MTTITVDRAVLEQAMNALLLPCDRWNRYQLKLVKSAAKALETALYAPATVPEFPANWAQMIHYPECWDTAAYPELRDAIHEALAWSGCSVCKPAHQEQLKPGECWPERIMKQWDEMRDLISKGDKSSLPRDWFESLAEMRLIDAPTTAPEEQLRKDAERYRWCVDNNMVLAGGTTAFGWPIAPVGREEWDRYIDHTKEKP